MWIEKIVEKIKEKGCGKEQCIIIILIGVLLLIIVWPTKKSNAESLKGDSINATVDTSVNSEEQMNSAVQINGEEQIFSYKEALETQLKSILKKIDGAGNVDVMITLKETGSNLVLQDTQSKEQTTSEADAAGGTREIEQKEEQGQTIFITNEAGEQTPYLIKSDLPKIEGVLILCEGARSNQVSAQIVTAVQALFDIEAHKVVVIKMKS